MTRLMTFLKSDHGAVTVDWIVLTSAIVFLGFASVSSVSGGLGQLARAISSDLGGIEVGGALSGGGAGTPGGGGGWTAPENTAWNGKYAGNYWGEGASQAGGDNALARSISLASAAADAPDGFNLDNPMMSPGENGVVYTSNSGTHYSVNGHVSEIGASGGYVDQWGGTRSVQAWNGS